MSTSTSLTGRFFTTLIVLVGFSAPALAQNGTTGGALTLAATLDCISVRAGFSGDANSNNSVAVQFQKHTGDTGFHPAYSAFVDRRATLSGAANPYASEARVSIVGLVQNTTYDVRVTWSDPDGVTSGTVSGTVTTLTSAPPTGGTTITVTDNASLSSALSTVSPGQTIHMNAGTYSPFTVSSSGNSGAWIVVEGASGATVSGSGVNQNIAVNGNFVVVTNLTLSASDFYGITIGSGRNNVIVSGNTLQNVSSKCSNGPTTSHYGDTGINIGGGASNILVLNNSVTSTSLQSCVQPTPFDGPGTGIGFSSCTNCSIKGNSVTGAFRDAISSDDSNNKPFNVDLANNTVTGYVDDGIESKGDNVNVRMWGNIINSSQADTCMAGNTNTATNQYGPIYVFRNVCRITGTLMSGGGEIYKFTPAAPAYFFHNSMDASNGGSGWAAWEFATPSGPFVSMNNIIKTTGSMSEHSPANSIFDYNIGVSGSSWAYQWNNSTTYASFSTFRSGTGQEAHGQSVDPQFSDTALHLKATSPAINAGVVLNNFNSLDSAWPYASGAPDIGAYETVGTVQTPTAPTNLRIITP
jgi:hypothetical protein